MLFVLATITLILPNYTLTTPGPVYSAAQLGFVSVVTLLLYGVFLYTQTIRHRDYFIVQRTVSRRNAHMPNRMLALSVALLLVSLLGGGAAGEEVLAGRRCRHRDDRRAAGLCRRTGRALILLPESVAAIAAARKNDLQKSINLALGSSLATIGLTIPAVAVVAYVFDKQTACSGSTLRAWCCLALTFIVSMLTFGTGRTNILFGLVHMLVFAVFVFLVFVP